MRIKSLQRGRQPRRIKTAYRNKGDSRRRFRYRKRRYVRRSYNRRQKIFVAIRFQTHIVFERMSSFAADSARRRSFAYNIAQRRKTNVQPRFDHKIGYNFVRGCDNKRTKLRARGSGRLLGRRKLQREPLTRIR